LKIRKNRGRKADSTVIATVILVSVTIVLAFVAAFWISGLTEQNMKFQKVGVVSAVCTWEPTDTYWKITLRLKNAGTATATMTSGFINDVEIENYTMDSVAAGSTSTNMTTSTSLGSGASVTINIYIDQGYASLSTLTTVNIKIHCAGGMEIIKPIELI
jgi:FlaG/FlaF family flagellin (archaellin)